MIYPDSFEQKTGFTAIRQWIAELCTCDPGVQNVNAMNFSADEEVILRRIGLTEEFRQILLMESSFPAAHTPHANIQNRSSRRSASNARMTAGSWLNVNRGRDASSTDARITRHVNLSLGKIPFPSLARGAEEFSSSQINVNFNAFPAKRHSFRNRFRE